MFNCLHLYQEVNHYVPGYARLPPNAIVRSWVRASPSTSGDKLSALSRGAVVAVQDVQTVDGARWAKLHPYEMHHFNGTHTGDKQSREAWVLVDGSMLNLPQLFEHIAHVLNNVKMWCSYERTQPVRFTGHCRERCVARHNTDHFPTKMGSRPKSLKTPGIVLWTISQPKQARIRDVVKHVDM